MGFKLGQRTYVLEFGEGTHFDGAVIRMRPASIATTDRVTTLRVSEAFPLLLEHVQEWNLEAPDGSPLPIEPEACVEVMEYAERNALVQGWYQACIGVSTPLETESGAGDSSPDGESVELSIPMEPLSEHHQN